MQSFEYFSPTRVVFGRDAEARTGALVKDEGGSRVLVVYGGGSAVRSGLLERVCKTLTEAGAVYETFGGVQPNPRLSHAREGVRRAVDFGADFILAVGGGSVIDTAKAIANGCAAPDTDLWDLWTGKAPILRSTPIGVVLTISAAGSETSDSAVLTNEQTHQKRGVNTELQRPRFAVMNPLLTTTLPPFQIGCGVVDIMMHTMDRYFNPGGIVNRVTDELSEGLLRAVIDAGRIAVGDGTCYEAMSDLMWAGSLSHNNLTGLGGVKDFSVHLLGHELSAMFDVAHGASLSTLWAHWARFVLPTDPARFAHFGEAVWGLSRGSGESDAALGLRAIDAAEAYFAEIGMPTCFTALGIGVLSEAQLSELAERCTFFGARTVGKFRVLGHEDLLAVYRAANR